MSDPASATGPATPATGAAERWAAPTVEGRLVGVWQDADTGGRRAQQQLQAERDRGYEAGVVAGRAAMQDQITQLDARVQRLDVLLLQLARPLAQVDAQVEQQLTVLAIAVGKQLARRELKQDPTQIIGIIRSAIERLPVAARDVRVHLHPDDAAVVRERLATPAQERAWTVIEDPTLTRGGCLIRSESSLIDSRLESRVNAIVAALLGEERAADRPADQPDAAP